MRKAITKITTLLYSNTLFVHLKKSQIINKIKISENDFTLNQIKILEQFDNDFKSLVHSMHDPGKIVNYLRKKNLFYLNH